jgi:hypothetical protein
LRRAKENEMEVLPPIPDLVTWLAVGSAGAFGLAALARSLEAVLDLDAR